MRISAQALLLLTGCYVSDDRVYGGGEVTVQIDREDTDTPSQTWQLSGLDADLTTRGQTIGDAAEPSCGEGPGAWLWEDNGYPIELWGCSDDMWFILDLGDGVELGQTVSAWESGTTLTIAINPEDDVELWLSGSDQATVGVGLKGITGLFEDEQAEGDRAGLAAVTISWSMDSDTWVRKDP